MSSDSSDEPLSSRCKRRKRIPSSSDEDTPIARRKRHRILTDSDDDSDSSVGPSTSRRSGGALPLDSDDASTENDSITDWGTDASDNENEKEKAPIKQTDAAIPATAECQSDSSDGNSEKCPICLLSFSNQDIGTPETCEHLFCSDCITEWSKNVNTCPVDRLEFKTILVRRKIGGKVIKRIPVSSRTPSEDYLFQEEPTFCEVCESSGSEETMLLCDTCDLGFHMHCLQPPLNEVPENEWHCPRCSLREQPAEDGSRRRAANASEASSSRTASRVSRMRGTRSVQSLGIIDLEAPSTSQQQIARFAAAVSATVGRQTAVRSTSVRVRKRKRRKRRSARAVIVEYELKDGEKFPIKRKRAKVVRRRKKKAKQRVPRTAARRNMVRSWVRGRLAEQINGTLLGADLAEAQSSSLAQPPFSLFGARDQLEYFPDSDEEQMEMRSGSGASAVAIAPRSFATAILDSHRQIRRKRVSIPSPAYASSAPDILSGILESQTLLHSKNSSVSVRRDGTLNIKVPQRKDGDKPKQDTDTIDRTGEALRDVKEKTERKSEHLDGDKKINIRDEDSDAVTKKAPAYPGSGRGGGGGWRGGGGQRDYQGGGGGGGGNNYARGGSGGRNYGNDSYGGGNSNYRDGGNFNSGGAPFQGDRSFPGDNPWQNEGDFQNGRQQRERDRDQYNPFPERVLMPPRSGLDSGRGRAPPARFSTPQGPLRPPQSWINRSLPDAAPFFRQSVSDFQPSPGGYPAEPERQNSDFVSSGVLSDVSQAEYLTVPAITGGDAPPQPPIIRFLKPQLSEDERSDDGAEEGDKYDPTEPTLGDSGSEGEDPPSVSAADNLLTIVSPPRQELELVADYGSGSESPVPMRVSPEVLDLAVQQVLREHRDLISGKNSSDGHEQEDAGADSDGDCPNFSIYSAASMGMVKNNSETVPDVPPLPSETGDEDLVQEDDPGSPQAYLSPVRDDPRKSDSDEEKIESNDSKLETADNEDLNQTDKKDNGSGQLAETDPKEDERKSEKGTRAPIKIVLASPSCVKKSTVDLYDKDDLEDETASEAGVELGKDDGVESEKVGSAAECDPDKDDDDDDDDDASTEADPQIADVGKFTESISDAEDERSYTPCLDENKSTKSKDTTLESEKEAAGIEGLDTEMISDDEGNELFNDPNNQKNDSDEGLPEPAAPEVETQPAEFEEGEIVEKGKLKIKEKVKAILERPEVEVSDDDKKKKKRKPDGKDKSKAKGKRALDSLSFKKLSKSGKERNYRERDDKPKNTKLKEKRRSRSAEKENKEKKDKSKDKKKEKRKDIERYDVRNVISDKSRRVKDVFGRDTSRPRSKSPDSRPGSAVGRRSPSGPLRSVSRNKRSASKGRQSPSQRRTSSIRGRRSGSRIKRSISRARKSASRERKSVSPRFRRSVSPRTRRSPSPRRRKSISLKRRSASPRGRSPPNRGRRSISPRVRRSKSPRIRRSLSRGRNKRKRSLSRGRRLSPRPHRGKSPRRRPVRRSRSKLRSISRNRSRSPKNRKPRKPKRNRSGSSKRKISRSPVKSKIKRKRSGSFSPGIVLSRSPSRERLTRPQWQQQQQDKSPLYQDWTSGSQSMSPSALMSPGWTPPPVEKSPEPRNLRVILTTKDKSKKKEKKKKTIKRNKAADRVLKRHRPKETGPSKEVFTSGNNILVSVSFNKNQNGEEQPVMPPPEAVPKKKKRKGDPANKAKKDKNKMKKKRSEKNKRTKDLENKKPVAIIDLDRSPFKELTPSPKAVIVLSDSENGEKEEELMERQEMLREELMGMGFPHGEDSGSPPRSLAREAYVSSAGPKTPPEPAVKFTIQSKSNPQLRAVNPLHEEEDEAAEDEEVDARGQVENRSAEAACKGPNTPPEPPDSPPSSPDAYDPFEPTKSGSATPERVSPPPPQTDLEKLPEKRLDIDLLQVPGMSMSLEAAQKSNLSADDVIQSRPISPREKVLALLKSTRNSLSPANPPISTFGEAIFDSSKPSDGDLLAPASSAIAVPSHSPERLGASVAAVKPNSPKLIYSSVTPTVVTSTPVYPNLVAPRVTAFGSGTPPSVQRNAATASQRTMLPSPAKSSPLKLQTNKLFLAKPSPIKSTPIKPMPAKSLISKLPLPSIKPMPARKGAKNQKAGQNGNEVIDLDMDMDSPYSPGSSDFGDLFEPPSDNGKHASSAPSLYPQKQGKFDGFDSLFNAKARSNNKSSSAAKVTVRQMKKTKGKTQVGVKMDEDSLKILDDLPSSAVEMQFLKKLNRQERVVDEVKLVLKPHYNKKHVTKEEYKDILRRAVPKICHNRSGEINPAKIQALIEAYVRKFRKKAHQVK